MSKKSIQATTANFEQEILSSTIPVVVDFWAPWCGPCRLIGPALEELAGEYEGKVKVAKVNVDEEPELAAAFRVQGIPTLYALSAGKVVDRMVGFGGKGPLAALFERLSAGAAVVAA
ncbi:thioredoxin [Haliangium sp.]|uniref:thioredoxin n=1 Tax=Haliangium sp. TaxID=2663208 RepID=UPI003D0CC5E7